MKKLLLLALGFTLLSFTARAQVVHGQYPIDFTEYSPCFNEDIKVAGTAYFVLRMVQDGNIIRQQQQIRVTGLTAVGVSTGINYNIGGNAGITSIGHLDAGTYVFTMRDNVRITMPGSGNNMFFTYRRKLVYNGTNVVVVNTEQEELVCK
jgi:hypothetical protein